MDNAVKYSPGRRLDRRSASSRATGHSPRHRSRDEGLGIPSDEQEQIFDKFISASTRHLTRGVGGTGLGLYICRELVEQMGGRIWVVSEPDEARRSRSSCLWRSVRKGGEGRNRTGDTTVFSRVLYQLSYLARGLQRNSTNS